MKQFGKILKFELKGYLKNKIFVGITLFLVIAIAVAMFIPNIISAFSSNNTNPEVNTEWMPVMLICSDDGTLLTIVNQYFTPAFSEYNVIVTNEPIDEIKGKITSGEVDCAFVLHSEASYTYYVNNRSMYDMNTDIATSVLTEVYRIRAMIGGGLTPEQTEQIMNAQVTGTTELLGKDQAQNFLYTYIMIMALYMVILLYGQMVATNVATEKSSRAMEVLITSAKPTAMMFGKVLASCIAGFTQLVLVFGTAILFYNLNKENLSNPIIDSIFNIPIELFIYMIVFFILGFLIYAFMFGAIGSTASKLEDINTSTMPLMFAFVIAFIIVMISMTSGSVDNTAITVCSYIPFTSPMAMFTRICLGTVAWYEIAISIGILIGTTIGIGVVAARIYRVGVLLYGMPPKFITIIKTVFGK